VREGGDPPPARPDRAARVDSPVAPVVAPVERDLLPVVPGPAPAVASVPVPAVGAPGATAADAPVAALAVAPEVRVEAGVGPTSDVPVAVVATSRSSSRPR
jgi:hypothetical protein